MVPRSRNLRLRPRLLELWFPSSRIPRSAMARLSSSRCRRRKSSIARWRDPIAGKIFRGHEASARSRGFPAPLSILGEGEATFQCWPVHYVLSLTVEFNFPAPKMCLKVKPKIDCCTESSSMLKLQNDCALEGKLDLRINRPVNAAFYDVGEAQVTQSWKVYRGDVRMPVSSDSWVH